MTKIRFKKVNHWEEPKLQVIEAQLSSPVEIDGEKFKYFHIQMDWLGGDGGRLSVSALKTRKNGEPVKELLDLESFDEIKEFVLEMSAKFPYKINMNSNPATAGLFWLIYKFKLII